MITAKDLMLFDRRAQDLYIWGLIDGLATSGIVTALAFAAGPLRLKHGL
jgi:hypothetical protein